MSELYKELIDGQALVSSQLIKTISPPTGGITIVIKNMRIIQTIDGYGWVHPNRRKQYIKLFENLLKCKTVKDSIININLGDHPVDGYFNFCRVTNNTSQFILPNHRFTLDDIIKNTETYDDVVKHLRTKCEKKIPKFYMSCIVNSSRIEYFKFALQNKHIAAGYVYGGSVHRYSNAPPQLVAELKNNKLAGESHVPFEEHNKYKYVIYNDGNTLSDKMRLLLCTDSIIVRKESNYEEFYSYLLKPGVNYINYKNEKELTGIHNNLENNPDLCSNIRNNNQEFVDKFLKYDVILDYVSELINMLF